MTPLITTTPRADLSAQDINQSHLNALRSVNGSEVFERLALCHNTRRCLWEGQSDDGRITSGSIKALKRPVFTWAGAPDVRVPYAEEVVAEHCLIRNAVWRRGETRLGPRETSDEDGTGDEDKAGNWQIALEYFLDVNDRNIECAVKLFHCCIEEFGYGILQAGWRRRLRNVPRSVTFQQVMAALVAQIQAAVTAGQPPTEGGEIDENSVPPALMKRIVQEAQAKLDLMFLSGSGDTQLTELLMSMDPAMDRAEAKRAATTLARGEPSATYYAPELDGGMLFARGLVPFIHVLHGTDLTADGQTPWFACPEWLTALDVETRAAAEDWDPAFKEAVLTKSNQGIVGEDWTLRVPGWALGGAGVGLVLQPGMEIGQELFQVVYDWRKVATADGLEMVKCTLVHPHVNDAVGFSNCLPLEDLPFLVETREDVALALHSRGVPEEVVTQQNLIKDTYDSEGARGQLGSNPPLNRITGESSSSVIIEPGIQLFTKRGGGPGGNNNEFLRVPAADVGALALADRCREMLDRRFFRSIEGTDPDMKRMFREDLAFSAAKSMKGFIRLLWKVLQGHVDAVKVGRIAGRAVDIDLSRDSMQGDVDVSVSFNVDSLNQDSADKFMDWVTKLSQADRAGSVDWNEVVNIAARMSNPDMARRIILPREQAAKRVASDQNNRVAQMAAGVPMQYEERQTAPEMRMQVMQQWMQQPENLQRAQNDQLFGKQMQDELTYLQRQVEQYQKNPVVGRTLMKQ